MLKVSCTLIHKIKEAKCCCFKKGIHSRKQCKKWMILFIFIWLISSCNFKPVHPNLWSFGDYSKRFQPIFEHYKNPEDSLKRKAAQYLIENMGEHFYYEPDNESELDSFFLHLEQTISLPQLANKKLYETLKRERINIEINKRLGEGSLSKPDYIKRADFKTLTPEYLIENIDDAFIAWELPWAKSYSFDVFCRYILPYRYGNEVPELWRKTVLNQFKWIPDSVQNIENPLEVASMVNKQFVHRLCFAEQLTKKGIKQKISHQLNANVFGNCEFQAGIGVSILRALGIPAAVVNIPNWGNVNYGHELTGMLDKDNNWHYFNFGESGPEKDLNFRPIKMCLEHFDKMENFSPVLEDVTEKMVQTVDLEVRVKANKNDEIYLCAFGNLKWVPISKGTNSISKVIFENVGRNRRIFLAAKKKGNKLIPVSKAFCTDTLGNISYFNPDYSNQLSVKLLRKYPYWTYKQRMAALIGGEFSVSDNTDFSQKNVLYTIKDTLQYYPNILKTLELKGKYLRYEFPNLNDSTFDGPAEISFFTTENDSLKKIAGKYFGSPQLSQEQINLITDNNILTYVEVWDCDEDLKLETGKIVLRKNKQAIYVEMELDSAVTVTHVGICPRNDKNGIYPGMTYELFMWDNEWKSMGVKVAKANTIDFDNIPDNAVLWLRNLDEGKEERIFTMKNGEQLWW